MLDKYIVFVDNLDGFTEIPKLRGTTLEETIENICENANQHWFYYIYRLKVEKLEVFGDKVKVDVYKFQKTVGGKFAKIENMRQKEGLTYAMKDWSTDTAWVFADFIYQN